MSEAALQRKVLVWLRSQPGIYVVKYPAGIHGVTGTPDILCCVRDKNGTGRFLAIEVKRPATAGQTGRKTGAVTSQPQLRAIHAIRKAGGTAIVVSSLDEVVLFVNNLRQCSDF